MMYNSIQVNPYNCVESMITPTQWVFSLIEIILSTVGVILNTVLTVICHNSVPMPYSQRRVLASLSINFAFLSGFQLARNFFMFLVMQQPCLTQVTSTSCKLQEFPLLFCYIHCAVGCFLLGLQSNFLKVKQKDKQAIRWYLTCSVWQSTVAAMCVAITLLFTAFDKDLENRGMSKCSILLAVSQSYLTFGLLTLLILLHFLGLVLLNISCQRQKEKKSWVSFTIFSLKEIMQYETLAWQTCLFVSGCVALYRHLFRDTCEECSIFILEISFVILPLCISFLHPLYVVWFLLPVRDAATRTFPFILSVLPEYSLIPPQVANTNVPLQSPRTETTVSSTNTPSEGHCKPSTSRVQDTPTVLIDDTEWNDD